VVTPTEAPDVELNDVGGPHDDADLGDDSAPDAAERTLHERTLGSSQAPPRNKHTSASK
jgi:hypothetical protein